MSPQHLVSVILIVMFAVAATGPIYVIQLALWCILCVLFGMLGKHLIGNILWK
jgi:hypothetical protein